MARTERRGIIRRLFGARRSPPIDRSAAIHRLEEKRRSAAAATEQWLTLLREMEHNGESDQPGYETYYRAYLQAREQEKRAEIEVFNLRQGLVG